MGRGLAWFVGSVVRGVGGCIYGFAQGVGNVLNRAAPSGPTAPRQQEDLQQGQMKPRAGAERQESPESVLGQTQTRQQSQDERQWQHHQESRIRQEWEDATQRQRIEKQRLREGRADEEASWIGCVGTLYDVDFEETVAYYIRPSAEIASR